MSNICKIISSTLKRIQLGWSRPSADSYVEAAIHLIRCSSSFLPPLVCWKGWHPGHLDKHRTQDNIWSIVAADEEKYTATRIVLLQPLSSGNTLCSTFLSGAPTEAYCSCCRPTILHAAQLLSSATTIGQRFFTLYLVSSFETIDHIVSSIWRI